MIASSSSRRLDGQAVSGRLYFCSVAAVRHISPRLRLCLNPEEIARLGSYRLRADQERFLVGRALLRMLVGDALGVEPRAVPLQFTAAGKPIVADGPHVNVSHSGDVVALALAGQPVGVDVETMADAVPFEAMSVAYSTNERAHILRRTGEARRRLFYEIWTRKEALLKADGRGLHDDLPTVETLQSDGSWHPCLRLGGVAFAVSAVPAPAGTVAASASSACLRRLEPHSMTARQVGALAARLH